MDKKISPKKRAEYLLSEMSLEEKMGQIVGYFPKDKVFKELEEEYPYGVGEVACLEMRTFESLDEAIELQTQIQKTIMNCSPHNIPAIFHMEGVFGALITKATTFPTSIARAASWNPDLENEIGQVVGEQSAVLGVGQVFAPVLDINRDSRFGRISETYGEDPCIAAAMGTEFVKGIQSSRSGERGIDAVAKHFVGFHAGQGAIHGADTPIPERLLQEVYAKPFQAAITEGGLRGIMPSYNSINGVPVSVSEELLTVLLRDKMGFSGLIVSDYSGVKEVHTRHKMFGSMEEAGYESLKAGMDIELPTKRCFNEQLMEGFQKGRFNEDVLDEAVLRILETKFRLGLFEEPFAANLDYVNQVYDKKGSKEIAYQSAAESIVLLKNNGILPIQSNPKKIAIIGYHADTLRSMFGGYSHFSMNEAVLSEENTMAGIESDDQVKVKDRKLFEGSFVRDESSIINKVEKLVNKLYPNSRTIKSELEKQFPEAEILYAFGYGYTGTDCSHHEKALEVIESADLVILTLGGKNGTGAMASMGEGIDGTSINLPETQESFIKKAAKLNKPMIGVHIDGRPISSDAAQEHLQAILEVWNLAEMGPEAIVDTIVGKNNPSGKLPVSVAYNSGQLPLFYNHANGSSYHQGTTSAFTNSYVDLTHEPRYFFGYGLSYTNFEYKDLRISELDSIDEDILKIDLQIQNVGDFDGTDIVQLYIQDETASIVRPNMELIGFKRVYLKKNEMKKVTFVLNTTQLAFLDKNMNWKVEAGRFKLLVGQSSNDILLDSSFEIKNSKIINGNERHFYTK
ncbi:hypothetical protein BAU15_00755 [Enterococcus sp. JM4C]|nr:hypothetical protein BAU15_00755 [Enterococcus sp. JM4C]